MTPPDDFDPPYGIAEQVDVDLRRIVAPNPSAMTYRGTNTYLLGQRDIAVIDPGPESATHLAAILESLRPGQRISHILVTHAHLDHSPLAASLSAQTGAPVLAYGDAQAGRSDVMQKLIEAGLTSGGEGVHTGFTPDVVLPDGAVIESQDWRLKAHWTPGHFGNHMCFAWGETVFTGDLVMGWASSLVSPPDGDLTDFMASCERLRGLGGRRFHAGHGAPINMPAERLDWLLDHRRGREASIRMALEDAPATATELTTLIYADTPPELHAAAQRNVLAHLIDLCTREIATTDGPLTDRARFHLL